ncbi:MULTISPECIES: primosomal protein N' [unclassified Rothia (in: high G+C Gram-positive bacteria)]|uniref:primosomal protein N' n=1 Tax=unclassified Rothia (in: high G+C Gram-positive bacteria) TaxID=2689056 RepID=UPI001EF68C31|nr:MULTISPECIES: primosomal protein N' [unclassified Rothia (in: high G+C Gram-positive bacteria)]
MGSQKNSGSLQTDLLQGFPELKAPALDTEVELPVARVQLDSHIPHLDRLFDYEVPEHLDASATVGARVKVKFSGREMQGFIRERVAESSVPTRILPLRTVISPVPVVGPEIFDLADAVAQRCSGTVADVLRLAVPPRVARVEDCLIATAQTTPETHESQEAESDSEAETAPPATVFDLDSLWREPAEVTAPATSAFDAYTHGTEFIEDLAAGASARAVMTLLPATGEYRWEYAMAQALLTVRATGRGAIGVVPDQKTLARLEDALDSLGASEHFVRLTAADKPSQRYENFLKVLTGEVRLVVGTRSAAYAPVHNLGFVACWDDADANFIEPRAPYCHARDVLLLRAAATDAAALFMSYSLSSESARLVRTRWATYVGAERPAVREATPRVLTVGDDYQLAKDPLAAIARIPQLAYNLARSALETGPVLVQVARSGYVPNLACQRCRMPVRCTHCYGPVAVGKRGGAPECSWCGRGVHTWACNECGFTQWRMSSVGALRTAEELGRAFPQVPVISSAGEHIKAEIDDEPALVIATPGAEPVAPKGYAAALLLDADRMIQRDSLRAPEEALRRWFNAAALVRPFSEGGRVVSTASDSVALQALVRWDPVGFALDELNQRGELGLPPAMRTAAVTGEPAAVHAFMQSLNIPEGVRVVGPTPLDDPRGFYEEEPETTLVRAILFFSYSTATMVTPMLRSARASASALRLHPPVQIRCDGLDIL